MKEMHYFSIRSLRTCIGHGERKGLSRTFDYVFLSTVYGVKEIRTGQYIPGRERRVDGYASTVHVTRRG